MRLLLVYPGPLYSTIDLARGFHKAFQKIEDVKLFSFQFEKSLTYHDFAQKFIFAKNFNPETVTISASEDILIRILKCRPDWVLFISGLAFPATTWEYVKQLQGDLKRPFKTAVFLTESPYVTDWEKGILERVDAAFTTDYGILDEYKQVNPNLFYIRHAHDQEIHHGTGHPRKNEVFFVGTGFPERQRLLEEVDWSGIDLQLYGNWMYMTDKSPLFPYLKGENLQNVEAAEKYRNAKIALNIFRTVQWPDDNPKFIEPSRAKSLSPRIYEAMACGSLLFTDWREELDTLPIDSYVLWGDAKDLEEKVRYYLSHDAEREGRALAGQKAVEGHTFDARAREILERLKES